MAYTPTTPELGIQPVAATSTTQNHPLGYVIGAYDPTYGAGEFVYLKGVANTVVGSLVIYNNFAGSTTLAPSTAHLAEPLAVAMSANVASQYGWYQTVGCAVIAKTAVKVSPSVPLFLTAAGQVSPTASAGKQMLNTISVNATTVASATGTITAQIAWPFAQGQIT